MCAFNSYQDRSKNRMYGWLKEKFAKEISISQSGKKNSQYGTMWIHHKKDKLIIKIKKEDLNHFLKKGWSRGRVENLCKFCKKEKEGSSYFCSEECKSNSITEQLNYTIKEKKEKNTYISPFKGKAHSETTKKKMKHNRNKKENNPMYGTIYINHTDLKKNKRVKKELLKEYINKGWEKGMNTNFN